MLRFQENWTTYDNDFAKAEDLLEYYEEKIWNKRYVQVISVDEIIALIQA